MENIAEKYAHIKGWGIDANPKNDPTYPMKHHVSDEHNGYTWERPAQQPVTIEVLQSTERPNVSAVFGTSVPPSGLSGQIRRFAFKYSENEYGHWLPLLIADRVNVVEGIIDDLRQGYVPNIFAEKGFAAEWKHDRAGFVQRALVTALVSTAIFGLFYERKKSRKARLRYKE